MAHSSSSENNSTGSKGCSELARGSSGESERIKSIPTSQEIVPAYIRVIHITDRNGRKRKLLIPSALDLDRPKKPRTTFSGEQIQILELEFAQSHFISEGRRQALSLVLHLSETQIKVWFQNRRTKFRRAAELKRNGDAGDKEKGVVPESPFPRNPILLSCFPFQFQHHKTQDSNTHA